MSDFYTKKCISLVHCSWREVCKLAHVENAAVNVHPQFVAEHCDFYQPREQNFGYGHCGEDPVHDD